MDSKWGQIESTQLGSFPFTKITAVHFILICLILVCTQPAFVASKKNETAVPHINMVKLLASSGCITLATYFAPLFLRQRAIE